MPRRSFLESWRVAASAGLLLSACRAEQAPSTPVEQAAPRSPSPRPSPSPTLRSSTVDAGGADEPEDAGSQVQPPGAAPPAAPEPDRFGGASFPPPDLEPPYERSKKEGDGVWRPVGEQGDRAAEPPRVIYETVIHPHPRSRFWSVTIVAIDLARARLHMMAGTDHPKGPQVDASLRTGLVPQAHRDGLLAVFNGGFMTHHGWWSMMLDGQEFFPPQETGCTVATYADGTVRIGTFSELEPTVGDMTGYRQTPPCMVENGALHPKLARGVERPWGGHNPDRKTRRRSAVGIDASGRILFYGLGQEVNVKYFAEGLRLAGAQAAAELDINWNWTRFLLFGRNEAGELRITSTLAPHMNHNSRDYVERPTSRDFFYLRRAE